MRHHQISLLSILVIVPLGSLTTLSPWDDMRTKHSWNTVPSMWETLGSPPAGTTIDLCVALEPQRENALIEVLHEVSDPTHPKYGTHLSREQVAELVAPGKDTLELVHSWLGYHSVPSESVSVTHGGSSLTLAGVPISQANNLLGASYQLYRHVETNETIIRTIGYSLPATLHTHVQTVVPTTCFAIPYRWRGSPLKHSGRVAARQAKVESEEPVTVLSHRDVSGETTPSFLRWQYKTWGYTPTSTDQNSLGIVGFNSQYPSPWDLGAFMDKYKFGGYATFRIVEVNGGGYDATKPHFEANLDVQYAEAMAYPTPHTFYSTGRGPQGMDNPYLSWLNYILKQEKIPQTISISYGNEEKDYPRDDAIYACRLFAQLGIRGVSVLFASGDFGVGSGDCKAKDGKVLFGPMFPATCACDSVYRITSIGQAQVQVAHHAFSGPFVTSVGGATGGGYIPEIAASLSSGGFSNLFSRPNYQQQAVSSYLQNLGNQYHGMYNPSGRGFPDLAAQALEFPIILEGKVLFVSGTSASAPVVAAIISLLNDYLISQGRSPLGFLNPWLYGGGLSGLNDITSGSNPGCNTDGFPTAVGWDPVTGLGTPDFEQLLESLPVIPDPTG
ncbi:subtilisin-like protein [Lactarius vividus]|nr:subtilisin-like protein [Lactarius vividus]